MLDQNQHTLRLSHAQLRAIVDHARAEVPREACGLVAGVGNRVTQIIPIENIAARPDEHFVMEPQALLRHLQALEDAHQTWLGVYHSHPAGPSRPSATDIRDARLNTPGLVHLIASLDGPGAQVQAWSIMRDSHVYPIELLIGSQTSTRPTDLSPLQQRAIVLASVLAVALLIAISVVLLPPPPPLTP